MARVRELLTYDEKSVYGYRFTCPGCLEYHVVPTTGVPQWEFNGDVDRPTFKPSIRRQWMPAPPHQPGDEKLATVCHSRVTDGRIEFLDDCTHQLRGQTVDLPED